MIQTPSQSPEPALASSGLAEPRPTPANTSPGNHDLPTILALKDSLGAALTKQGKYSEAATLLREVLTTRESLNQSPTSPGMLCTMNNLAAALHHQGHLASAESLHRRVLESHSETLGVSHPDTLTTMYNLASLLTNQGPDNDKDNAKLSEGVEMLQRALQLSQQVNGPRNPSTLRIMGNQVNVLLRQEKYEQAERLAREVLALRREVLRAQHPEIATAIHSLAVVLKKLGKVDEAKALRREELALRETDREERAGLKGGNGLVAMEEGRYKEAETIFQEGLVTGMA
ncbi:hypothetical protein MMC21_007899 [Puttea exsequens]|nr:hypothetical protein [Puttea exsequens]